MADETLRDANERGLYNFVESLRSLLIGIQNMNAQDLSVEYFEEANLRLEDAISTLQLLLKIVWQSDDPVLRDFKTIIEAVLTKVRFVFQVMTMYEQRDSVESTTSNSFACPTSKLTGSGRPVIVVEREQIEFLRELHFSWAKIASLLGISESTLRRRRRELNLNDDNENWTALSDSQLEDAVKEIRSITPNIGQRRLLGALRAGGFRIQRWRVRNCLRRQDPLETALRWTTPVYRRKYSVPTPNSLWHIDGNHKLIRYRFVVHCCVDGYSRLIVYAALKDNNRADTVLELFMKGVQEFGLPSRVRSDHGLENVGVAQYMLENRGLDRGSMITGSSVHNCRVERAHRDIYAGVLCHFANIFSGMEDMGILDPLNEAHLFALHFVYIPRINRALQHFTGQWNNHPVSGEHQLSPLQIFTSGILENIHSGYSGVDSFLNPNEIPLYGFDPDGPFPLDDNDYQVSIPAVDVQLTAQQLQILNDSCHPLNEDGDHGRIQYLRCMDILINQETFLN